MGKHAMDAEDMLTENMIYVKQASVLSGVNPICVFTIYLIYSQHVDMHACIMSSSGPFSPTPHQRGSHSKPL